MLNRWLENEPKVASVCVRVAPGGVAAAGGRGFRGLGWRHE